MPRIARGLAGGEIYHIINRGNRRSAVFHNSKDYEIFIELLQKAKEIADVKLYSFVLMPNHFHFLAEPNKAEDLSSYMQWLLTSYVRYYNKTYKTSGHLWQGRYKSFIVQRDNYLFNVVNYIEQNPQRANLKNWKYTSINNKINHFVNELPIELPKDFREYKKILNEEEKKKIENSIQRQSPYGEEEWMNLTAEKYNIISTIKPRGRPRKQKKNSELK